MNIQFYLMMTLDRVKSQGTKRQSFRIYYIPLGALLNTVQNKEQWVYAKCFLK